jgi:hypothetical protein
VDGSSHGPLYDLQNYYGGILLENVTEITHIQLK